MENLDNQIVSRVWQRVQQKPQPPEITDQTPLLSGLRQEWGLYTVLVKRTNLAAFRHLLNQVTSHIACVKGMHRIGDLPVEEFTPPQPRQEQTPALVRRAYTNALGRLTEYEKRTSDSTFGPVFQTLAAETKHTLRSLAEICGTISWMNP